jgi:peptidoglycan/xylan/chitin deacetylase (PgdA/CDA1 family)
LIYHRALRAPDPLLPDEVDAAALDWQVSLMAREFNVLSLEEACERMAAGTLPARAAAITFDDGYADNVEVAMPILRRHGLTATFFVATAYLGGGVMFNDRIIAAVRQAPAGVLDLEPIALGRHPLRDTRDRRAAIAALIRALKYRPPQERAALTDDVVARSGARLPAELMMRPEQVKALRQGGMSVGGHTATHPILARISPAEARVEVERGRTDLEGILNERVTLFAYPNGEPRQDYGPEHVAMVKELGFRAAVSTRWAFARRSDDSFQLPRCTPWDRTPRRFGARLINFYLRPAT